MDDHEHYMRRCIELARRAEGRTSPNPLVGSVVVDDEGRIIAEGFHAKAGMPHAEVVALDIAGDKARGQTLYVSLEPCCHTGKTPPCTDRVIKSGVKHVVFGMTDPNPKVAGGGQRALEKAGIKTTAGVLESECRYLNRAFLKWIQKQLPWVTLKMASTLDGKIADHTGKSRWISGPDARRYVQQLRNHSDAILLGAATAIKDDPELVVHDLTDAQNPVRAIVDAGLQTPAESKLCSNKDGKTWLFAAETNIKNKASNYPKTVRLIAAPETSDGHLDLRFILHYLGTQNILSVLCEGGGRLGGGLFRSRLVDEVDWIVAPKILCDPEGVPSVAVSARVDLDDALTFRRVEYRQLGEDMLIHGLLSEP